ncbi:MAG: hypothetical protein A3G38_02950 [Omnitrophica WOR_2 bacterium RIFCSPLOWO2_12_FULL_51_8]|nr:MAG: hypothetical protein A3G38_02950 [Omnitrophica WOR_2 bacterium RIFCSPLOWO2_12_FULL_51_8]
MVAIVFLLKADYKAKKTLDKIFFCFIISTPSYKVLTFPLFNRLTHIDKREVEKYEYAAIR